MRVRLINADVMDGLAQLADESIHCVVTSPPYYGLRDYGIDGQIGLESTYLEYIEKMVTVFREVRRVLREDGTLWLNIGDSYSNDTKWGGASGGKNSTSAAGGYQGQRVRRGSDRDPKRGPAADGQPMQQYPSGLKPKDLMMMPARLAISLQDDGWYLRSDIIWHKPNPMPESVNDRPTTAHEHIFLFAKSQKYYYDAPAIAEPVTGGSHARGNGVNPRSRWPSGWDCGDGDHKALAGRYKAKQNESFSAAVSGLVTERNKRTVWTVPTQPYPEAHFATFPEALIEPCIKAGCPPGGVVLDPFGGSGTTAIVARRMGCDAVLIEISPAYCELVAKRLSQGVLELQEATA